MTDKERTLALIRAVAALPEKYVPYVREVLSRMK